MQEAWTTSAAYQDWLQKRPLEEDPALAILAEEEAEKEAALEAQQERIAEEKKELEELEELHRNAFTIQEWWRFNRNRKHLDNRARVAALHSGEEPTETSNWLDNKPANDEDDAAAIKAAQLDRVEAAYQKALQVRGKRACRANWEGRS